MSKAILGRKLGMTQIFTEEGQVVPVTVIESGNNVVIQKKTTESHGVYAGTPAKRIKELTAEQIARQKEEQAKVCEKSNIVSTTAKVFGRKAPRLLEKNVLDRMAPGSIVVDMAVSGGGNVEGSKPFEDVVTPGGVTIMSGEKHILMN